MSVFSNNIVKSPGLFQNKSVKSEMQDAGNKVLLMKTHESFAISLHPATCIITETIDTIYGVILERIWR